MDTTLKKVSQNPKKTKPSKNIHKFIGPALGGTVTGATMGAALASKGGRLSGAGKGGLIGGLNSILWKATTIGYSKAVNIPYKEVVASDSTKTEKLKSYGAGVAAAAPIFAAKTILGDIPRKTLEEVIEQKGTAKLKGLKIPKTSTIARKALSGRALYQAGVGGGFGILTAPAYIKGVELLNSDNKKDKAKGLALIGGAASVYQGAKGFGEGMGIAKTRGLPKKKIPLGIATSISRVGVKLPAALISGAAIAAGRKKEKSSVKDKLLMPTLITGAVGAIQNTATMAGTEAQLSGKGKLKVVKSLMKKPKMLLPAAAAGAASGMMAGAIGALVVDKAVGAIKKKQKAIK